MYYWGARAGPCEKTFGSQSYAREPLMYVAEVMTKTNVDIDVVIIWHVSFGYVYAFEYTNISKNIMSMFWRRHGRSTLSKRVRCLFLYLHVTYRWLA